VIGCGKIIAVAGRRRLSIRARPLACNAAAALFARHLARHRRSGALAAAWRMRRALRRFTAPRRRAASKVRRAPAAGSRRRAFRRFFHADAQCIQLQGQHEKIAPMRLGVFFHGANSMVGFRSSRIQGCADGPKRMGTDPPARMVMQRRPFRSVSQFVTRHCHLLAKVLQCPRALAQGSPRWGDYNGQSSE
jgi:hypothetical protein